MAKAGRKTKLTDDIIAEICGGIESGLTYEQSANMSGVSKSSFFAWKRQAEAPGASPRLKKFVDALKKSNITARMKHLEIIRAAAVGGRPQVEISNVVRPWKHPVTGIITNEVVETREIHRQTPPSWVASAWILERRFPDEFSLRNIESRRSDDEAQEADPLDQWVSDLNDAEAEYGSEQLVSD